MSFRTRRATWPAVLLFILPACTLAQAPPDPPHQPVQLTLCASSHYIDQRQYLDLVLTVYAVDSIPPDPRLVDHIQFNLGSGLALVEGDTNLFPPIRQWFHGSFAIRVQPRDTGSYEVTGGFSVDALSYTYMPARFTCASLDTVRLRLDSLIGNTTLPASICRTNLDDYYAYYDSRSTPDILGSVPAELVARHSEAWRFSPNRLADIRRWHRPPFYVMSADTLVAPNLKDTLIARVFSDGAAAEVVFKRTRYPQPEVIGDLRFYFGWLRDNTWFSFRDTLIDLNNDSIPDPVLKCSGKSCGATLYPCLWLGDSLVQLGAFKSCSDRFEFRDTEGDGMLELVVDGTTYALKPKELLTEDQKLARKPFHSAEPGPYTQVPTVPDSLILPCLQGHNLLEYVPELLKKRHAQNKPHKPGFMEDPNPPTTDTGFYVARTMPLISNDSADTVLLVMFADRDHCQFAALKCKGENVTPIWADQRCYWPGVATGIDSRQTGHVNFDGDNHPDIVLMTGSGNHGGTVELLLWKGDHIESLGAVGSMGWVFESRDLDSDGQDEFVVGREGPLQYGEARPRIQTVVMKVRTIWQYVAVETPPNGE